MKFHRFAKRVLAALAFVSIATAATVPAASAAGPAVILIVNTQQIFNESKVGQSIRTQLQDQAKKLQAEDKKGSEALQAEAKKLSEQRSLLSADDFKKKVAALEKKEADRQEKMRARGDALQLGVNKARAEVEAAIRPIFADIMKKNGATLLLDQSVVLAGGVDLDVTAEALKALDAKVTKIDVKPISPAEAKKAAQ
ncbi:OmpH family outer membrane protein [Parvibaculum sp.]|uniref:OmpH family outer membrane protein n=1 Tax=Parvibaculum sp. TaxID=2024848 RepID=UPI00320F2F4D